MELTLEEVKPIIKHIINTNFYNQEHFGAMPIGVEIIGHCGIGKSMIISDLAKEYDANFIKLNLAMMCETGDLCGFPIREHYVCKDDDCQWITPELIKSYAEAGYHITTETRMSYALPSWLKDLDTSKPTILCLDDYNRAIPALLAASMELIYQQEYLSWKLPPRTQVVLTSNYDDGSYSVNSLDAAQKSRFVSFNVKFDANAWSRWAQSEGIDSRCQNFLLLYHTELMNRKQGYSKVNARNYTMFANIISGIDDWSTLENQALILQIASGCFLDDSDIVGGLFTQFISNKLDKLIDPELLVTGSFDRVKRILLDQLYDEDLYRADIANVITTRFINFASNWIDQKKDIKVIIDRIVDIIDCDKQLLSEDLLFSLIKTLNTNHMGKCSKLILNPKIANKLMS